MHKQPGALDSLGAKLLLSILIVAVGVFAIPWLFKEGAVPFGTAVNKVSEEKAVDGSASTTVKVETSSEVGRGVENEGASLASYMPPECLPNGHYPETQTKGSWRLTTMACGDSNWWYRAMLVEEALDGEVVFYQISNNSFIWHRKGGERMELRPIGNPALDSFEDFGADQPVKVIDFTLNGKRLNILKSAISFRDGGLGGFQGTEFKPNSDFTGGTLTVAGRMFGIDFVKGTVSAQ